MNDPILIAVISLGVIALIAAAILYVCSKKFAVYEDPRIGKVAAVLPQANCGGCGYPGCGGFAEACVKAGSLDGKLCPVGGQAVMAKVADILGLSASASETKLAVVRCNGSCENRPRTNEYDGAKKCSIAAALYGGETGCSYGCLGCGDCVDACQFGAIKMSPETGLPVVDAEKCTACGACAKACPKGIIEIRIVSKDKTGMVVTCVNKDKGAQASKACKAACIGCSKCQKVCGSEAIVVANNLAYIDPTKCIECRDCEKECPTGAIHPIGMEPLPRKSAKPAAVVDEAAEAKPAKVYEPIIIKYDAALLPSQQIYLACPVEPSGAVEAAKLEETGKAVDYATPLLPSQQILLNIRK